MASSDSHALRESTMAFREDLVGYLSDGINRPHLMTRFDDIIEGWWACTQRLESGLADTNRRLDVLGELTTVTIGINLATQLILYVEKSRGQRIRQESTSRFHQRCGIDNLMLMNLTANPHLIADLDCLRLRRNGDIHGVFQIISKLVKYRTQSQLVTALRAEDALAAHIIQNCTPFVFLALASEVIHYCKKHLSPPRTLWSKCDLTCLTAMRRHDPGIFQAYTDTDICKIFKAFADRPRHDLPYFIPEDAAPRQDILQAIQVWLPTVRGIVAIGDPLCPGFPEVNPVIENAGLWMFCAMEVGVVTHANSRVSRVRNRLTRMTRAVARATPRIFRHT